MLEIISNMIRNMLKDAFHCPLLTSMALAALFLAQPSAAAVIVNQAFSWGTIGVANNNSISTLTVLTDGTTIRTGTIVEILPAQPGIFTITGLPVDQTINSVDIVSTISPQTGGSEIFTMDSFTVDAPASTTGDSAQITVGGRIRTTGSTTGYIDGTYNGQIEITFNF